MAVGFPMLETLFPILSFFLRKKILERSFFLRLFRESSSSSKAGLKRYDNKLGVKTVEKKIPQKTKNITRLVEIPLGITEVKACCYDVRLKGAAAQYAAGQLAGDPQY